MDVVMPKTSRVKVKAGDVVTAMGTERTMSRLEELFTQAGTRTRS